MCRVCCPCPRAGGGVRVLVTATGRRQRRPCLVTCECFGDEIRTFITTRSQGGGLGGGNVPPVHVLSMTTYLSPCFYVMPVSVCRRWCECACDRDTTTTPCPVHHHRSQGGGLGGGNVPPLLSPIPLSHFVPLSLLTTWSSPRFSFSCVYVCVCSCDYDGGVWGGRSPPQL